MTTNSANRLLILLLVAVLQSCATNSTAGRNHGEETAKIETVISSITALVDIGRFDLLGQFYADEVLADYSSLWGNEPRLLKRSEVGPGWAGFIPGFDTTRHQISNIRVQFDGNQADASADVTASHWLDGDAWIIAGEYKFTLHRNGPEWVVNRWSFTLESEQGDRALVDQAEAIAEAASRRADR